MKCIVLHIVYLCWLLVVSRPEAGRDYGWVIGLVCAIVIALLIIVLIACLVRYLGTFSSSSSSSSNIQQLSHCRSFIVHDVSLPGQLASALEWTLVNRKTELTTTLWPLSCSVCVSWHLLLRRILCKLELNTWLMLGHWVGWEFVLVDDNDNYCIL